MSVKLWTEEQFNCPVCLDLPKDPVTIPCGHSYCMECIKDYWGKDDHIGIYSCPQCRRTFCPKPSLSRNTMLAEAVEQLKKGGVTKVAAAGSSLSPGSAGFSRVVPCDVCQENQLPSVKSCLVCMASYCEIHIKPHYQSAALKKHELITPTAQLNQKICPEHKYLQEFYCRTDQRFICWLCTSNHHKGHDTVSTKAERTEKQKLLVEVQTDTQQKIQEREVQLKELKKVVESLKRSAERVLGDSENILTELLRSIERMRSLVKEILSTDGKEKVSEAEEIVERLELELVNLRRKDSVLQELANTEDNIRFIENYQSHCVPMETDLPNITANPEASFEQVRTAVFDLREQLEDICTGELGSISKMVKETVVFTLGDNTRGAANKGAGPRIKAEFFKLFSALGSKNSDRRDQGDRTVAHSLGIKNTERRGPVYNLRVPDIRRDGSVKSIRGSSLRSSSAERQEQAERESRRSRTAERPEAAEQESLDNPAAWSTDRRKTVRLSLFLDGQSSSPVNGAGLATSSRRVPNSLADNITKMQQQAGGDSLPTPNLPSGTGSTLLREIPVQSLQAPQPRTRAEFLTYSCKLTLDPDTAHRRLHLSDGNTVVTLKRESQPYHERPERFDGWTQVLCREGLFATRCYWEIEWRGRGSSVGVAYLGMPRKGGGAHSGLGYNDQSWSLELSDTCCAALHRNQRKDILVAYSPRVGVFLDYNAGSLSFFSVDDRMSLLHSFMCNFSEPLYPGFGVGSGVGVGLDFALGQFSTLTDSVKICTLT
ncbi:tripartite motif-containing protein 16 isoform X3 [Amia ocellicauda]|uniref:tripartite motif-containing protein 16 isoform X3 n=1 Tax=Amia ocellicauda TaxID=2972642 RepID=UPI003464E2CB